MGGDETVLGASCNHDATRGVQIPSWTEGIFLWTLHVVSLPIFGHENIGADLLATLTDHASGRVVRRGSPVRAQQNAVGAVRESSHASDWIAGQGESRQRNYHLAIHMIPCAVQDLLWPPTTRKYARTAVCPPCACSRASILECFPRDKAVVGCTELVINPFLKPGFGTSSFPSFPD